jgi:nucleotide-binding universal stress UspA family protein
MKKILVPTDFSDGAFNALVHAVQIARHFDAEVHVVHAFAIPPTGTALMVDLTDILRKNSDDELAVLKRRIEASPVSGKVHMIYEAHHGTVIDVINRAVEKNQADMVIMGTQGASGITEKWLGTNTAAAARNVDVPMIAIPVDSPFRPFKNVLFATDFKVVKNSRALNFVAKIAKAYESHLRFLHVRKDNEKSELEESDAFKSQMRDVFGKTELKFSFVIDSDIDHGIEEALAMHPAELLITVRHEYGFFEGLFRSSVSQKLINHAAMPILIIKG